MLSEDVRAEIEKLKLKKIEITNRMNAVNSFEDKEDLKLSLDVVENQISLLEKLTKNE